MTQSNVLTGEMRERVIATEFDPATFEVEKSHITAFARAIGDGNPLWNDEIAARRSQYGGLIAPPTFTRLIVNSLRLRGKGQYPLPGTVQVDGGSQWRYFEPIRPGDRITQYRKITDVYERTGSAGQLIFIIGHSRFVNQFDETVVTLAGITIRHEPVRSREDVRPAKPGNGRTAADTDTSDFPAIEPLDWGRGFGRRRDRAVDQTHNLAGSCQVRRRVPATLARFTTTRTSLSASGCRA